jgi:DMSO reductase family type II enzyme molybdopterin subunit
LIDLTRRELLIAGAIGSVALSLRSLMPKLASADTGAPAAAEPVTYGDYRDLYRSAWRWDRVVRGTHLRANCFSACAWDLFVKDGVVWHEEQSDVYAREVPGLPDYAPRGCQKGACYSTLMTNGDRITHPLERVGPRGSGRWRRISWEQALTRLADAMLDAIEEGGPETVVYDNGTSNVDTGPGATAEMRLFALLGSTFLDGFGGTGDLALGAVQTWGTTFVDGSSDDWMRADTLVFWSSNPVTTRMPDAHFATEARYRGTTVITVAPDYSASSIHASLWVNPRQATDAALALGIAQGILERGAVDEAYVREQTDLPFLVCEDTKRFLRQSDLEEGGKEDIFYVYDIVSKEIVEAPGTPGRWWSDSLDLGEIQPALSGSFQVTAARGTVTVRPVMEHLRERLAAFTPEYVEEITGVAPSVQERMADQIAGSERTLFYPSWGSNRQYHADLLHRALILISALRGHHGRTGAGVRFAAWLPFTGSNEFTPGAGGSWLQQLIMRFFTPPPRMMESGIAGASTTALTWTPSHLFLYLHGGLDTIMDADASDPSLPRPAREYMNEALERGWTYPLPAPGNPPRVLITSGCNPLRRWPSPQIVEKVLWPKLEMIAVVDFRLSTTGMKADLLLPAAGYYEKMGIKYAVALSPYVVVGEQAVAPLGESKSEWEIFSLLAKRIQGRAVERGVEGGLAEIYDQFSMDGAYGPKDEVKVVDRILQASTVTAGVGWEAARKAGAIPIASAGGWGIVSGIGSEVEPGGSLSPSRIHVEEKHAWPTLTGRQQFYIDHPWFFEADEVLPRYRPLPRPGGEHPILLTGGHTRWSIHAIWRAHPEMLQLQRGEPVMWISVEDAAARGIQDGARMRVWNDHGSFQIDAKVTPAMPPGEALVYHAWEPYQFADWRGNMEVVSSPYKPTHFAGDYGHLRYRLFFGGPVHVPRGIPIEIEPA